ncbi:UNVERIFIED_CONTAM: hypothetical protein K2H54_060275 [Gekko kuhli]
MSILVESPVKERLSVSPSDRPTGTCRERGRSLPVALQPRGERAGDKRDGKGKGAEGRIRLRLLRVFPGRLERESRVCSLDLFVAFQGHRKQYCALLKSDWP